MIGAEIPLHLKNMLTAQGYDNFVSLQTLTPESITEVEEYARTVLSSALGSCQDNKEMFGIFASDPTKYRIAPGNKVILNKIGEAIKNMQNLSKADININSTPPLKPISKTTKLECDKEKEAKKLRSLIIDGLKTDFSFTNNDNSTDKNNPISIIVESFSTAKLFCLIGTCKQNKCSITLSRTDKRSWSTFNYYRHFKKFHKNEGEDGSQPQDGPLRKRNKPNTQQKLLSFAGFSTTNSNDVENETLSDETTIPLGSSTS